MLDIKLIRQNPDLIRKTIVDKKSTIDLDKVLSLDGDIRDVRSTIEELNRQKNETAKQMAQARSQELIEQGKKIKGDLEVQEASLKILETEFTQLLFKIPNIPTEDTPIGPDENSNVVIAEVGKKPVFNFIPKDHAELGNALDSIDSERAAKVSGSRFAYLKRDIALLEFALIQFCLSVLTNEEIITKIIKDNDLGIASTPFIPVVPPVFIKPEVFQKMARLEPADDRYHIPSDDLYLIGSAEHTLGAMHMDETFQEQELPLRYIGFSTAFRREAGSYGKDTKGILRLHQFDKLEMESFSAPEASLKEHLFFVAIQEHLMQTLGLAYKVVLKCTGDMGDPNARGVDIETWMPGQDQYRETHSADLMTDYQARRLNTKVKREAGNEFVHTNDATAFAIGRTIIAIMENYQQEDGSIAIPEALQPFMFGKTEIR